LFIFERRCAYSSRISCSRGDRVGECEVGGGTGGVEAGGPWGGGGGGGGGGEVMPGKEVVGWWCLERLIGREPFG
jgi:hypothetical protein